MWTAASIRPRSLVGISGWITLRSELAYWRERGISVVWLEEIWERGTAWAVDRALEVAGAGALSGSGGCHFVVRRAEDSYTVPRVAAVLVR